MSLLSEHEQAVDPNLLQLAEAWEEAVRRAGGEEALEAQLKGSKQSGRRGRCKHGGGLGGSGQETQAQGNAFFGETQEVSRGG